MLRGKVFPTDNLGLERFLRFTHAVVASAVSFSRGRYGSATFIPKYSSTVLSDGAAGYFIPVEHDVADAMIAIAGRIRFLVFIWMIMLVGDWLI